jgi:hypothetical protein
MALQRAIVRGDAVEHVLRELDRAQPAFGHQGSQLRDRQSMQGSHWPRSR